MAALVGSLATSSRATWLTTLLIVIFLFFNFTSISIYNTQVTPASAAPPTSTPLLSPSTPKTELDNDPLRIYIPPPSPLHTNNPLEDIWAADSSRPIGPQTAPSKVSSGSLISSPNCPVQPFDISKCPVQPFDISKCPSIQRVQSNTASAFSSSSDTNTNSVSVSLARDRPLITYAYVETTFARINLQFFLVHGLHSGADFVFILNGETDVAERLIPNVPNVSVIKRDNTCFDLGAHAEVLSAERDNGKKPLRESYKRFILMNASIRGPLVPHWSRECWSESYLSRVTEKVKLVGSSLNCMSGTSPHVQSMIWATDSTGLDLILSASGIGECFTSLDAAVAGEVRTTAHVISAGYAVDVMLSVFQTEPRGGFVKCNSPEDFLAEGGYYGMSVHPYETMFARSNGGKRSMMVEKLSQWQGMSGYSSYAACGM